MTFALLLCTLLVQGSLADTESYCSVQIPQFVCDPLTGLYKANVVASVVVISEPTYVPGGLVLDGMNLLLINVSANGSLVIRDALDIVAAALRLALPPAGSSMMSNTPLRYTARAGSIFTSIDIEPGVPLPPCHRLLMSRIEYGYTSLVVYYAEDSDGCTLMPTAMPDSSELSDLDLVLMLSLLAGGVLLVIVFVVTPLPYWIVLFIEMARELRVELMTAVSRVSGEAPGGVLLANSVMMTSSTATLLVAAAPASAASDSSSPEPALSRAELPSTSV